MIGPGFYAIATRVVTCLMLPSFATSMGFRTNILFLLIMYLAACSEKSDEAQVIEWITQHAVPLSTVQAGNGFDDLEPLKQMVGDSRIVSLGNLPTGTGRFSSLSIA